MNTKVVVGWRNKSFNAEIIDLYLRYLNIAKRYFESKGYDVTLQVSFPEVDTTVEPQPEVQLITHFIDHITIHDKTVELIVFCLPWQVKPIYPPATPDGERSFPRPDIGYAYTLRPLIHKGMSLVEGAAVMYPIQHEWAHLVIRSPTNLFRTYIIDFDACYLNVKERFEGLNLQKIPRVDELLDWGKTS